jgi:hypothetical protein
MNALAVARDRWETLTHDADRTGAARRGKELRRISDQVGRIAARTVHGCIGEEEASLAALQHDVMLLIEERVVSWAAQVLNEREQLGQSFGAQAESLEPSPVNWSARAQ